ETAAFYAALLASAWAVRAWLDRPRSVARATAAGATLALVGLARLEAFGYAFVGLALAALEHRRRGARASVLVVPAALVVVALAADIVVTRMLFSTWTPISGQVKQWWSLQVNGRAGPDGWLAELWRLAQSSSVSSGLLAGLAAVAGYAWLRRSGPPALRWLLA